MPAVYFRTDGNEEIATGHIMRCLSIARACASFHADICFLVSDDKSVSVLRERFAYPNEFPIQCLQSSYQNLDAELPALQAVLLQAKKKYPADSLRLFIDSYFVTETYLSTLQAFCKTAYLDDLLAFDYPVDFLINYDIHDTDKEPSCCRRAAHKLIGASYAPLREQFQNVPYQVRPKVEHILLSTGGTDTYNAAGKLLHRILTGSADSAPENAALSQYHYHVITSRLNSHFEELHHIASQYPTVRIHENVQDMAALMQSCDAAVSAGGTTLYELCAVGVPSISFATADNQLNAVKTFAGKNIIPYAGDIRVSPDDVTDAAIAFLYENIRSYEKRQKSSLCMRAFIDGNGAVRIARALTEQI